MEIVRDKIVAGLKDKDPSLRWHCQSRVFRAYTDDGELRKAALHSIFEHMETDQFNLMVATEHLNDDEIEILLDAARAYEDDPSEAYLIQRCLAVLDFEILQRWETRLRDAPVGGDAVDNLRRLRQAVALSPRAAWTELKKVCEADESNETVAWSSVLQKRLSTCDYPTTSHLIQLFDTPEWSEGELGFHALELLVSRMANDDLARDFLRQQLKVPATHEEAILVIEVCQALRKSASDGERRQVGPVLEMFGRQRLPTGIMLDAARSLISFFGGGAREEGFARLIELVSSSDKGWFRSLLYRHMSLSDDAAQVSFVIEALDLVEDRQEALMCSKGVYQSLLLSDCDNPRLIERWQRIYDCALAEQDEEDELDYGEEYDDANDALGAFSLPGAATDALRDAEHEHECGSGCDGHHHGAHIHEPQVPFQRSGPKVGRNDACPCGSGKKYKKCCQRAS